MVWTFFTLEAFSEPLGVNYDSIKAQLDKVITKEMKHSKIPGISIAIIDRDEVWTRNLGYADSKQKTPFSSGLAVPVGEISVLFTNIAIMQLAEEGKLDLDKPLQTYIPEFSMKSRFPDAPQITVRSILTDHSGLPTNYFKNYIGLFPPYFIDILNDIKNEYTAFPPNYIFSHSAIGSSLLGIVIERVSGESFNDYITKNILDPLEMDNSSFVYDTTCLNNSGPFYNEGMTFTKNYYRDIPELGLYTSVNDLSHFIKMILANGKYQDKTLLQNQTLENMFHNQSENIPLDLNMQNGIGWALNFDPWLSGAGKTITRGSGDLFNNCFLLILPDYQLGVIVAGNAPGNMLALANETAKLALKVKAKIEIPELKNSAIPPIIKLSPNILHNYEGDFITDLGLVTTRVSRNKLIITLGNESYQLIPRSDNTFTLGSQVFGQIPAFSNFLGEPRFSIDSIANRRLLCMHGYGANLIFGEAIESVPIPDNWQARCGKYQLFMNQTLQKSESILTTYLGFLILKINLSNTSYFLIIKPVTENEAIIQGLGNFAQETVRWTKDEGGNDFFSIAGSTFKRVH